MLVLTPERDRKLGFHLIAPISWNVVWAIVKAQMEQYSTWKPGLSASISSMLRASTIKTQNIHNIKTEALKYRTAAQNQGHHPEISITWNKNRKTRQRFFTFWCCGACKVSTTKARNSTRYYVYSWPESAGAYWHTGFEVLWPPSSFHQAKQEREESGRVSLFPSPFIYRKF